MQVDWDTWEPTMKANLIFVTENDRVLLIRKKTGLGEGKINGPGGKLEPGKDALTSAVREIEEEIAHPRPKIRLRGNGRAPIPVRRWFGAALRRFSRRSVRGDAHGNARGRSALFGIDELPFEEMWSDDRHWLRPMLDGGKFAGDFVFDGEKMLEMNLVWE